MDIQTVVAKFGAPYHADERTFRMGLDRRFAAHLAERFRGRVVLETCTGGGFTTIAIARVARPPFVPKEQFSDLPAHEIESLYLNGNLELYCLHFGAMAASPGPSEYRI